MEFKSSEIIFDNQEKARHWFVRHKIFLVWFDVPLGNLQLAFFNQFKEMFLLTTNLMCYETYATKCCLEH